MSERKADELSYKLGLTDDEKHALLAKIRSNQNRLDRCPRHLFDIGPPPYQFGMTLTCQKCGGEMKATDTFHYVNGYKAAGGDANDVMPGYGDEAE